MKYIATRYYDAIIKLHMEHPYILGILPKPGDDRLRRERLVPECEPSGAELVKSAQKIKC